MGLQIMHEVMDEVSYKSEGDVNSLQLIRLLRAVQSCGAGNSFNRRTLHTPERTWTRRERIG
jgi:hypothetical protein